MSKGSKFKVLIESSTLWLTAKPLAKIKTLIFFRTEYDAYRSDLEYYSTAPKTEINLTKQRETEDVFNRQKLEFERLRSDVQIKLKFLDENRVSSINCAPFE